MLDSSGNMLTGMTYNHGVSGRPVEAVSVIADNGIVGAATQVDRKTWGVEVRFAAGAVSRCAQRQTLA